MKNPMIENSINSELFEAINENEVNGGLNLEPGFRVPGDMLKPQVSADCGCARTINGACFKTLNCPPIRETKGICGTSPIIRPGIIKF